MHIFSEMAELQSLWGSEKCQKMMITRLTRDGHGKVWTDFKIIKSQIIFSFPGFLNLPVFLLVDPRQTIVP
jgi:hypothetical protein